MKKIRYLIVILFLLLVINVSGLTLGDVNNDGKVNSLDYILVRKYILKQITLSNNQMILADMNSDSKISSADYILIRKTIISGNSTTIGTPQPKPTNTPVPVVTSISLNKTVLSMDGGDTFNLVATINPSNAVDKSITWSSDNNRVAMVDANGKIIANTSGTANITATTSNGKMATCKVTVTVNITYKEIRYEQKKGLATNIWYAIIPSKYKMHYVFGQDTLFGAEKPSAVAKRVNATIAVNSQILGFPIVNGKKITTKTNVSGYDFTIKQNPNFKMFDVNTPPWDALIVTATKDYSQGISFKDINVGYDYEGDHVKYSPNLFMTLFAQIIMNRQYPDKFNPVPTDTEYYSRYYTQQELRQHERIPRTWIAYDSKGNQFVAVATGRDYPLRDGTKLSQAGLTYHEMIEVTQKYFGNDIVTLYNMDGGGSSTFVYKGEKLNGNGDIDSNGNRYERALYGTLYW